MQSPSRPGHDVTLDVRLNLQSASQSVTVDAAENRPLQVAPMVGKIRTRLEDLPSTVEILNRDLVDNQGGTSVKDTSGMRAASHREARTPSASVTGFLSAGWFANLQWLFRWRPAQWDSSFAQTGWSAWKYWKGQVPRCSAAGSPGEAINVGHYSPSRPCSTAERLRAAPSDWCPRTPL
jgi:hypothetical protein